MRKIAQTAVLSREISHLSFWLVVIYAIMLVSVFWGFYVEHELQNVVHRVCHNESSVHDAFYAPAYQTGYGLQYQTGYGEVMSVQFNDTKIECLPYNDEKVYCVRYQIKEVCELR